MQHLYLIRKLDSHNISKNISLVESVLTFNMCTWYRDVGAKNKNRLTRITNMASKLIGKEQKQLGCIYKCRWNKRPDKLCLILFTPSLKNFIKLPLGRHYRAPAATKNIYTKSFILNAITKLVNTIHPGTMSVIVVCSVHVCVIYCMYCDLLWSRRNFHIVDNKDYHYYNLPPPVCIIHHSCYTTLHNI